MIEPALAVAGVKPETIGYVECHATGTPLGDSIELAAMSRVFHADPADGAVRARLGQAHHGPPGPRLRGRPA